MVHTEHVVCHVHVHTDTCTYILNGSIVHVHVYLSISTPMVNVHVGTFANIRVAFLHCVVGSIHAIIETYIYHQ